MDLEKKVFEIPLPVQQLQSIDRNRSGLLPLWGRYGKKDGRGSSTGSGRLRPDLIIIKKLKEKSGRGRPPLNLVLYHLLPKLLLGEGKHLALKKN